MMRIQLLMRLIDLFSLHSLLFKKNLKAVFNSIGANIGAHIINNKIEFIHLKILLSHINVFDYKNN